VWVCGVWICNAMCAGIVCGYVECGLVRTRIGCSETGYLTRVIVSPSYTSSSECKMKRI
jgi:hypothetical protein